MVYFAAGGSAVDNAPYPKQKRKRVLNNVIRNGSADSAPSVERSTEPVKQPLLEIHDLRKTYRSVGHELTVLRDIVFFALRFLRDTCAIIGPLRQRQVQPCRLLSLFSCADSTSDAGHPALGETQRAVHSNLLDQDARCAACGINSSASPESQLIPTLTAIENVLVLSNYAEK